MKHVAQKYHLHTDGIYPSGMPEPRKNSHPRSWRRSTTLGKGGNRLMQWIIDALIKPLTTRIGTAVGAYLTAAGVASEDIGLIQSALPVAIGVFVDLVIRKRI